MKTETLRKQLSKALGHPVSVVNNWNGTFSAWVSTELPRAKREALTPRLAVLSGGRQADLNVTIGGKPRQSSLELHGFENS